WLADLGPRLAVLGSLEAKGLEYDATLVVAPTEIAAESPAGPRVLYVALTRATQRLAVLAVPADEPDTAGAPAVLREWTVGPVGWVGRRPDPCPRAQPLSLRATTCREASWRVGAPFLFLVFLSRFFPSSSAHRPAVAVFRRPLSVAGLVTCRGATMRASAPSWRGIAHREGRTVKRNVKEVSPWQPRPASRTR